MKQNKVGTILNKRILLEVIKIEVSSILNGSLNLHQTYFKTFRLLP